MVRTRTIREAAVYFQEKDPQTCLTETATRSMPNPGSGPIQNYTKFGVEMGVSGDTVRNMISLTQLVPEL